MLTQFARLIKKLPQDKVDEALEMAKLLNAAEDLEDFFDKQVERYDKSGCPKQIVKWLAEPKEEVLNQAKMMNLPKCNLPFLSVVPFMYLAPYTQMKKLFYEGGPGYSDLDPLYHKDLIETPGRPYWVLNIDDGGGGGTPQEIAEKAKNNKRSMLTTAETIAYAFHTDVLKRHHVWAAGSACGKNYDYIPTIQLHEGCAQLCHYWGGLSDGAWIAPSSSPTRIGAR